MHDFVSIVGRDVGVAPLRPTIMVGAPPGPDCFERSKSDNIICPDWWSRISSPVSSKQLEVGGGAHFQASGLGI